MCAKTQAVIHYSKTGCRFYIYHLVIYHLVIDLVIGQLKHLFYIDHGRVRNDPSHGGGEWCIYNVRCECIRTRSNKAGIRTAGGGQTDGGPDEREDPYGNPIGEGMWALMMAAAVYGV